MVPKDASGRGAGDSAEELSFPVKLHLMLEEASQGGFDDTVSWQAGGKSFKVWKPIEFEKAILRRYFNQTKYKSFQRQCNIYGFRRVHQGPNKGGYAHKCFARGEPELCQQVVRVRQSSALHRKPSFSKGKEVVASVESNPLNYGSDTGSDCFDFEDTAVEHLYQLLSCYSSNGNKENDYREYAEISKSIFDNEEGFFLREEHRDCVESTSDYSSDSSEIDHLLIVLGEENETREEEEEKEEVKTKTEEEEHIFPWKLHNMLDDADKHDFRDIVSWEQDGMSFKVHNIEKFLTTVMPNYFDQTKYESFRRQLNLYGFVRVNRGNDRGTISHPSFIKGKRYMCHNIIRKGAR